jgi:hypothetical protein
VSDVVRRLVEASGEITLDPGDPERVMYSVAW